MKQELIKFGGLTWAPLDQTLQSFDRTSEALDALGFDDGIIENTTSVYQLFRKLIRSGNLITLILGTVVVPKSIDLVELVKEWDFVVAREAVSVCLPFFLNRFMTLSGISPDTLTCLAASVKALTVTLPEKPDTKPEGGSEEA